MCNAVITEVRRGDVFYANLTHNEKLGSSVQSGLRPVVIIQNDIGNANSPTTIVVPLTSKQKRRDLPTHVKIRANRQNGLRCDSVALLEQVQPIDKTNLINYLGSIDDMSGINHALMVSVGLP